MPVKYLRIILIIGLILFAIHKLQFEIIELKSFVPLLENINLFWLWLSALAILIQYTADGLLSQVLLNLVGFKAKLTTTVKIAAIDVLAAHLFPVGEAGVIATTAKLYKKIGATNQQILFLTTTWGSINTLSLLLLLTLSYFLLPSVPKIPLQFTQTSKEVIISFLSAVIIIYLLRRKIMGIIEKLNIVNDFTKEIVFFIQNIYVHKKTIIHNKKRILIAIFASLIYYLANILSLDFAFQSLNYHVPILIVSFAYLASIIASLLTFAPAGIGTMEATQIIIFSYFGVPSSIILSGVIIFRLLSFWLPIPAGLYAYHNINNDDKLKQAKDPVAI